MSRGASTMSRFTCMCRSTSVTSSCEDKADMKDVDESEGEFEDESCESKGCMNDWIRIKISLFV